MAQKALEKYIWKVLEDVYDPELHVSLFDLGLVYKVEEDQGNVAIIMTLTTIGCPLFPTIEAELKDKIGKLEGVKDVSVELVFDPVWSMDRISEKGRAMLGI